MKKIIFFTILLFSIIGYTQDLHRNPNADDISNYKDMELVWHDEFEYTGDPDLQKWSTEEGFKRNREKQYYTSNKKNIRVENGFLVLEAHKDSIPNTNFESDTAKRWQEKWRHSEYSSASITSKDKGEWRYGRIEIKAKLPKGKGLWPAIWMLGENWKQIGWPETGEIDIMEHVGYKADSIFGTVHTKTFNHMKGTQQGKKIFIEKPYDSFHVFAINWTPNKIDFLMDGKVYNTFENRHETTDEWPFDQKFHLKMNIAVGGMLGGRKGIDDSVFPQKMLVDYVRVYQKKPQQYSVMTYNIRLDVKSDGENAWPNRKDFLLNQVKFYEPDILGTQEGLPHQIKYLNENLDQYKFIGEGRNGENHGEYSAIFYNSDKIQVLDQGTFWLSETPEEVSKGWDAAYIRICTYGLFQNRETNEKFWVFNTHLDNKGQESRLKSVELIAKKVKAVNPANHPFIITGDFNVEPGDSVIKNFKEFTQDSKMMSENVVFGPEGTFNGFQFSEPVERRIDYILFGQESDFSVKKYGVLSNSKDLKYPSDHLPVYVEFSIKETSNE